MTNKFLFSVENENTHFVKQIVSKIEQCIAIDYDNCWLHNIKDFLICVEWLYEK